jgi:hypothetical protein
MTSMVAKVDQFGRAGWLVLMILGFIIFFPLGLAILAYMLWSGRMRSCRTDDRYQYQYSYRYGTDGTSPNRPDSRWNPEAGWPRREQIDHFMSKMERKAARWGIDINRMRPGFRPTGNTAFDNYREDMIRRLEDEAQEFNDFLGRLRAAKDKEEFDQYMAERRPTPSEAKNEPPAAPMNEG